MTNKQLLQLKRRYMAEGYKMALKEAKDHFGNEWRDDDIDRDLLTSTRESARRVMVYAEGVMSSIGKKGEGYDKKSLINYTQGLKEQYSNLYSDLSTILRDVKL